MRSVIPAILLVPLLASACGSKTPKADDVAAATTAPPAAATTTADAAAAPPEPTAAPPEPTAAPPEPTVKPPEATAAPDASAPADPTSAPRLAFGDHGVEAEGFPAITPDGKTMVAVRFDGGELVGEYTTTLVFVDVASGKEEERVLSVQATRPGEDPWPEDKVKEAVAAGAADLAKHSWQPMAEVVDKTVAFEAPNLIVRGKDGAVLLQQAHPEWVPEPAPRCADFAEDKQPEGCDCPKSVALEEPREHADLGLLTFILVTTPGGDCPPLESRSYPIVRLK
ncbi:MAG: hypothetical protein IT385_23655 [Deltaproteobacteria bacterium]|nr:hypothetical protein [Deltaproteobacteria bacterium]